MKVVPRTRLAAVAAVCVAAGGLFAACGSYSGSDAPAADGGIPADGSSFDAAVTATDAGSALTICGSDTATTIDCDSFEKVVGGGCGVAWTTNKGNGTLLSGGAHNGERYCRYCGFDNSTGLEQVFHSMGRSSYQLSAWMRAVPDSGVVLAHGSLYGKLSDGGDLPGASSSSIPLTDQWTQLSAPLMPADAAVLEHVYLYPDGDASTLNCIDVDDVVLTGQ